MSRTATHRARRPRSPRSSSRSTSTAPGRADVSTGVGFYDHMLDVVRPARAGRPDRARPTATPTSTPTTPSRTPRSCSARRCARRSATRPGIRRFGDATVPLDEALVQCAVDVSGRPYCVHTGEPDGQAYVVIGGDYARLADPARLRDARLPRPDRAARAGAVRPRPAPHRRGAVQGVRPGVARRRRARPARDRRALAPRAAL